MLDIYFFKIINIFFKTLHRYQMFTHDQSILRYIDFYVEFRAKKLFSLFLMSIFFAFRPPLSEKEIEVRGDSLL